MAAVALVATEVVGTLRKKRSIWLEIPLCMSFGKMPMLLELEEKKLLRAFGTPDRVPSSACVIICVVPKPHEVVLCQPPEAVSKNSVFLIRVSIEPL